MKRILVKVVSGDQFAIKMRNLKGEKRGPWPYTWNLQKQTLQQWSPGDIQVITPNFSGEEVTNTKALKA